MNEISYENVNYFFKQWNPFEENQIKKLFFGVAKIFNAEAVLLINNEEDKKLFKVKIISSNIDKITNEIILPGSEPFINQLFGKNDVDSFEYNLDENSPFFYNQGIKTLLAGRMRISDKYKSIMLICSEKIEPYEVEEGDYLFKYGNKSKEAFRYLTKEISKRLSLVCSFNNENISQWKETIKQFDDIDNLLKIADYIIKIEKIDAAIDILVEIINRVKKDHNKITEYLKEIEKKYKKIINTFQKFINNNFSKLQTEEKEGDNLYYKLQISSVFLRSFFLHLLIKNFLENDKKTKDIFPSEKLNLLRHLGTAIIFYLNQCNLQERPIAFKKRELDLSGFTISICHLIGEYAHEVAGIERFFDIEGHLRKFVASQTVLYSLKNRYRDHIFHMIDICFLGLFLLNSKIGNRTLIDNMTGEKLKKNAILKNWFIASLLHDLGYVLNIYNYIHAESSYIESPEINELRDSIKKATEKAIDSNDFRGFNKRALDKLQEIGVKITKVDKLSHGVVSALHILNIIETSLPEKEEYQKKELINYYLPAISAITKHDMESEDISLKKEPVGFLLCICDELQDWERPSLDILPFKEKIAAAIRFGTSFRIESSSMLDIIYLKLKNRIKPYSQRIELTDKNKFHFILDYSGAVNEKDFNPFYSWLLKSFKLQRLNQEDILDIEIEFITGFNKPLPEFDRLILKRHKEKEWAFEDWINIIKKNKKAYELDGDKERLVIRLVDLWKGTPIKKDPIEFLDKITKVIIEEDGEG